MKIVGVRIDGTDEVWAAAVDSADSPTAGVLTLVSPVRAFWSDPQGALADPEARKVDSTDPAVRVVPPVLPEARVLCIGLNYDEHIREGSFKDKERLPSPTIFGRWTRSLTVGGVHVPVPSDEQGLDWEGEVAAWVGSDLRYVDAEQAWEAVVGYSTFNDLSARNAQKATSQFTLGKNTDHSGPIGPMVTTDECGDPRSGWQLQTLVNGEVVQSATTDMQIHQVGETLAHISRSLTIKAGDILCTGTPGGVGYAREPAWFLNDGDVVEVEVEGLGRLTSPIGNPR